MGIVTRRPDTAAASSKGNWALTPSSGATVAQILSDDSDLTFLSTTSRSALPSTFATFDIANLTSSDVPDGAAIKQVTLRAKVLQVAPSGGSSFLTDIIRFTGEVVQEVIDPFATGGLGNFLTELFRHLFSFPCPSPPGGASPTWQIITIKAYTNSPFGQPWTRDVINNQTWHLGRSDLSGQLSKCSEFYVDTEFNLPPVTTLVGPTETRSATNGVTVNTDATVTSSTLAFTTDDIGASITGAGIPASTTILSINSPTSIEMSANATASASGVTLTITRAVISTTTRPIFTITYTDTESDPQAAVRFRVFTAAQVALGSFDVEVTPPFAASPGVDNWILGTSTQWLANRDFPNGDYVVYAQSKQSWDGPELLSQWDAYSFTMHVSGPAQPVITATPNPVNNWVQLNVADGGGTYLAETYNIYTSDDSGLSYQLAWKGWQVTADAITGSAVLIDYLAPLNKNRWYKAIGYRTLNMIKVASDESLIATAVPTYHEFALKDPFAPSLNQPIGWMDDDPGEERSQGVHIPLVADGDKAYAIVLDGPLQGLTGDSKLLFLDPDDESWNKWKAIRAAGHTLLLQMPTGEQHWIRLKGQAKWTWHTDGNTAVDFRILEWGYIEVKAPIDPTAPPTESGVQ